MASLLQRVLAATAACLFAGGCLAQPVPAFDHPVLLLGEVHDNAAQHAWQLATLESLLRTGARPALLLEQFDRERQSDIDHLLNQSPAPDVDRLIRAGSGADLSRADGWDWSFYRPLIALALAHGLPIVAANVSRADARRVMAEGLGAHGFDPRVAPDIVRAQAEAIEASHCGMLDAAQARQMALAQVARDQFMARLVEAQAQRGVVLLAGNGHVRTDIGVPRWLTPATRRQAESIGLLEADDAQAAGDEGRFDRVHVTPRQPRKDPCGSGA